MKWNRALTALALSITASCSHAQTTCSRLKHLEIPSAEINLPTRGALVDLAKHIQGPNGGFCKVLGRIRSIDPHANPIRFEVNLPEKWNTKAVQFGGGAFDGYLHESNGLRSTVVGDRREPTPTCPGLRHLRQRLRPPPPLPSAPGYPQHHQREVRPERRAAKELRLRKPQKDPRCGNRPAEDPLRRRAPPVCTSLAAQPAAAKP